jgi:hypothetical protein
MIPAGKIMPTHATFYKFTDQGIKDINNAPISFKYNHS